MQFNFVNIFECFIDNCAWICHLETVVGKLCIEANFVNVLKYVELTFVNVLGKQLQYVQFNFVNICERSRQEYSGFNICTGQAICAIQLCEHL